MASYETRGYSIIAKGGSVYVTGLIDTDPSDFVHGDIITLKYDSSGNREWADRLSPASDGTPYTSGGRSITSDGTYIYVTGDTKGDLDGQNVIGYQNFFILKYNNDGERQSTKLYDYASGDCITTDGVNIYVAGATAGAALSIAKYNSDGGEIWKRQLSGTIECYGIATDGTNIYITGSASDIDGQTLTGGKDLFVVKYDNNGSLKWIELLGVADKKTYGKDVITNGMYVYVTGNTYGSLDGQSITGSGDAFVVKYDTSGNKQWTKLMGVASGDTSGLGITINSNGIYVTGLTSGNLDGQTITGEYAAFVTSKFGF